jgi:hypothetical protein
METSTAIVLGLGGGLAAWWLLKRATTPPASPSHGTGGSYGPTGMYTGSDLGPFKPILAAPGAALAYNFLAPINDKIIQPFVSALNTSAPVRTLNQAIGGPPVVTQNPDGSITRIAPDNWYSRNIGKPISHAGSAVIHALNPFD